MLFTHFGATTVWAVVAGAGALTTLLNLDVRSPWFFIGLALAVAGVLLAVLVVILRRSRVGDDALRDVWDIAYAQGYRDGQDERPFAQLVDRPRCQSGHSLRSIAQS